MPKCYAGDSGQISASRYEEVASSSFWRALVHYRHRPVSKDEWVSEADRDVFFLSMNGKNSPIDELKATLLAFTPGPAQDLETICRFPARYYQLSSHLGIHFGKDPLEHCSSFQLWAKPMLSNKVSVFFAAAYIESPSSMFGHTFLRFYSSKNTVPALMTATLNFAADTSEREGMLDFVVRGLLGGFPGIMDVLPLHRRLRDYSENQGRELWEYTLNLSSEEIKILVSHAWETKDAVFDYYFIDENCAFRTLALIAAARGDDSLLDGFYDSTVPIDTIRRLKDKGILNNKPIYWPSQTLNLLSVSKNLSKSDRRISKQIALNEISINSIESLPAMRRKQIVRSAFKYLSLQIARDNSDNRAKTRLFEMARILESLADIPVEATVHKTPVPPENGHRTSRLSLATGVKKHEEYLEASLRGAYHSWLDPLPGFNSGAEVTVLEGTFQIDKRHSIQLEELSLLDIKSLTAINEYFNPPSWQFSIGRSKQTINGKERLANHVDYLRGLSWSFMSSSKASILFGGGAQANSEFNHSYGADAKLVLQIGAQRNDISWFGLFQQQKYVTGSSEENQLFKFEVAWSRDVSARWSTYIESSKHAKWDTDIGLRLFLYW